METNFTESSPVHTENQLDSAQWRVGTFTGRCGRLARSVCQTSWHALKAFLQILFLLQWQVAAWSAGATLSNCTNIIVTSHS